jgi:hypothetical protein
MDEPDQFGTAVRIPLSKLITFNDGTSFNISLESFEVANAIAISGTPGGDGKAMVLDITTGALRDIAGNLIQPDTNITVIEKPDVTPPIPFNATIFYETGLVWIEADEPLDLTPTSYVDLEQIQIGETSNTCNSAQYPEICTLLGATVVGTANDSFTVTIQLTEKQRVAAIANSGTPGGDGSALRVDAKKNFVRDIAQNNNTGHANSINMEAHELADYLRPSAIGSSIDLNDGTLIIIFSEIIDTTPRSLVDVSKFKIYNPEIVTVTIKRCDDYVGVTTCQFAVSLTLPRT